MTPTAPPLTPPPPLTAPSPATPATPPLHDYAKIMAKRVPSGNDANWLEFYTMFYANDPTWSDAMSCHKYFRDL